MQRIRLVTHHKMSRALQHCERNFIACQCRVCLLQPKRFHALWHIL